VVFHATCQAADSVANPLRNSVAKGRKKYDACSWLGEGMGFAMKANLHGKRSKSLGKCAGITKSGQKLNGSVIKVSPSKTPIVPINRDFMPRDEKELERCERTVYVNQIDRAVPGSAVEAMFESFCGAPSIWNA
jgi:hypothetical protein